MEKPSLLLELKNVALVYRAKPALQDISWELHTGENWACLGPNGAGKTSLAKIICRQEAHASGAMNRTGSLADKGIAYVCFEQQKALCDRDKKMDDSEFRADASDPGTKVADVILSGRNPDQRYEDWVERLNIRHILNRGLRYISTGEMRKTLLIKAILSDPGLLILDNPLDGLDQASQSALTAVISELLNSPLPILLLCRQFEDVPTEVSHVIALNHGHIVACGTRNEVMTKKNVVSLMDPPLPKLTTLPPPAQRNYALPELGPLLDLHDVSISYGELKVLNNVSWRFERGQHCCVTGPNGCGKTTLLSLVTGDNHKAYGQNISLFGVRRGSGESVWDIKQKYGQLDTQLHLNYVRGMKVVEVVVSGFFDTIGLYDQWGDQQRDIALRWLATLGLELYARQGFDQLSFGLQRMVLLARAMVKSPIILLLDEPTLGLDGHHRKLILRAIDHIAQNSDTQIIFVSHCAGDIPACINQYLDFEPSATGFEVRCR